MIDQTLGRRPQDYKLLVPKKCKILAGSSYALVRPEFSALREYAYDRVLSDSPLRVLVSMGGIDQANASLSILKLLSTRSDLEITVLLSPRAKNYESVVSFSRDYQNICHIDFSEDMATLMTNHDISIGAPGSTSWERACLGLPSIIIPLADNQHEIGEKLKKYGAAIVIKLDELESLFWKSLQQILSDWVTYHTANLEICDGLGIYRVSIELDSYVNEADDYRLLVACEKDIGDIFKWQIHPLTRKYAVNTKIPTWNEHKKWMRQKLKSPTNYFYITSQAVTKEKMGAVRLDRIDNGCYEVSIYTDPGKYGQGVAIAALNIIDQLHPHITIEANVLKDNTGSQRLFEKAKYQRISDEKFIRHTIL
jgi:RimJ/RimL family protein N-acetyltransferase